MRFSGPCSRKKGIIFIFSKILKLTFTVYVVAFFITLLLCAVLLGVYGIALYKWLEAARIRHSTFHVDILLFTKQVYTKYMQCSTMPPRHLTASMVQLKWRRNHRTRGTRANDFCKWLSTGAPWGKQETGQDVLPITKAFTKTYT